jgi:hypothetical protein
MLATPQKGLLRGHGRCPSLSRRSHGPIPGYLLIERLCRQRVLSAACLAPPIGTYTLCQPIKVKKYLHHSLPNCMFLLFQMTQARLKSIRWHSPVIKFPILRIPLQASMSVSPSFRLQEAAKGPGNGPQYDLASLIGIRG